MGSDGDEGVGGGAAESWGPHPPRADRTDTSLNENVCRGDRRVACGWCGWKIKLVVRECVWERQGDPLNNTNSSHHLPRWFKMGGRPHKLVYGGRKLRGVLCCYQYRSE